LAFALIGNLFRFIFGLGKRAPKQYNYHTQNDRETTQNYTKSTNATEKGEKKKIFNADDGEYVEFEEVE
jgi:hypothetical protein